MVRSHGDTHTFGAPASPKCVQMGKMTLVTGASLRYHVRMDKESIDNLARNLADAIPDGLKNMREELETTFRSVLSQGLARLDLVTREEFEVQEAVLTRTREKLDALEKELQSIADK